MQKIILPVLLAPVGCGGTSTPALPPTAGDFVSNSDGLGTAQVFGIDFTIRTKSPGASSDDAIDARFVDSEQSSARKRFTVGDEIAIQLDSISESEVRFLFNDRSFGTLKVGDKVAIDEEQNVEVNGTPRLPTPAG